MPGTACDCSLSEVIAARAEASGVANPAWFRLQVDPNEIRCLMIKDHRRALRDTIIWLGLMIVLTGIGVALWPSRWSVPFWLAYGVLYG